MASRIASVRQMDDAQAEGVRRMLQDLSGRLFGAPLPSRGVVGRPSNREIDAMAMVVSQRSGLGQGQVSAAKLLLEQLSDGLFGAAERSSAESFYENHETREIQGLLVELCSALITSRSA
jgi:hypothetical protein